MGLSQFLCSVGVLLATVGGVAWMLGALQIGRRFLVTGILLAVAAPGVQALSAHLLYGVRTHVAEIAWTVGLIAGVVLFVRIFGARQRGEPRLSLKRRVGPDE